MMQDDVKSVNFEASSLVIYFILLDIKGPTGQCYNLYIV